MSNKMFPFKATVTSASGIDVTIMLNADGTFSGDEDAFMSALADTPQTTSDYHGPILWLIANAIKAAKKGSDVEVLAEGHWD